VVPASKVVIGFEPGEQAAGGIWEGNATDLSTVEWLGRNNFGGAFLWALNVDPASNPDGAKFTPELASAIQKILRPGWPYGKAPAYSKVDPSTGWAPAGAPSPSPPPPPPPPPPPGPPQPPTPGNCTTCHSIAGGATDAWCKENCCHTPPFCPPTLCKC
jgi:hypothetical protein